jgi:ribosomal protein L3
MPGRMGTKRKTIKNISVKKVDVESGIICLAGPTPGHKNSWILIRGNYEH